MALFRYTPALVTVAGGLLGLALLQLGVLPGLEAAYFPRGHDPFAVVFARGLCFYLGAFGGASAFWAFGPRATGVRPALLAVAAWVGAMPFLVAEAWLGQSWPAWAIALVVAGAGLAAVAASSAVLPAAGPKPDRLWPRAWPFLLAFPAAVALYVVFMRLLLPPT